MNGDASLRAWMYQFHKLAKRDFIDVAPRSSAGKKVAVPHGHEQRESMAGVRMGTDKGK